jgi:hypothetical protein
MDLLSDTEAVATSRASIEQKEFDVVFGEIFEHRG